jgi:hypothetical protein
MLLQLNRRRYTSTRIALGTSEYTRLCAQPDVMRRSQTQPRFAVGKSTR